MREAYVQQWRSYDNDRSKSNIDPFAFVYSIYNNKLHPRKAGYSSLGVLDRTFNKLKALQ